MTPLCVDVKEGAAALGVSTWTFRRLIDEGHIPTVKLPSMKYEGERGKRVLVAVVDLEAFIEKHRSEATA
jgi:excisionase family DNA binding protein